jgi:hypothetical protein
MFHALVLSAQALPIGYRSENPRAEQAVFFRLEGAVIDGLGFVTSPWDQDRIFSGEARLIRILSKSAIEAARS